MQLSEIMFLDCNDRLKHACQFPTRLTYTEVIKVYVLRLHGNLKMAGDYFFPGGFCCTYAFLLTMCFDNYAM